MFRQGRNLLAPAHAIAFGGIFLIQLMRVKLMESVVKNRDHIKDKGNRVLINKGGRPKAELKRDESLTVMCNIVEKKIIQSNAKCARTNVSVFLRELGLNGRIKLMVKSLPKEVLQLTGTLNHIAANLNQIAKKRNRGEDLNALDRALLNQKVRAILDVVGDVKTFLE
jgi:hypothetical protein